MMRARKQDSFDVGDIVWAQADNECAWPARILERLPHQLYEVAFFNDNSTATLRAKAISDFQDRRKSLEKIRSDMKFKEAVRLAAVHAVRKKRSENRATNDISPIQPGSTGKVKHEQSPAVTPKRKRIVKTMDVEAPSMPAPRKPSRYTRKAVVRWTPPKQKKINKMESEHDSEEEEQQEQKPESFEDEQPQNADAMDTEPPQQEIVNLTMLKKLRQLIDRFLEDVFVRGKGSINRPSPANITNLQEIVFTLKKTDLKVEDMMVKRISNSLYYIEKRLTGVSDYYDVVSELSVELEKLKARLIQNFSSISLYEQQYR